MRIIKFRVYDNFHGGIPHQFWFSDETGIAEFWQWIVQHEGALKDVQQYIGVKDKNGKDIYEGDIVKFTYLHYNNESEESHGEVFFDNGIFYFGRKEMFAMNDANLKEESIEIIGNIFEK